MLYCSDIRIEATISNIMKYFDNIAAWKNEKEIKKGDMIQMNISENETVFGEVEGVLISYLGHRNIGKCIENRDEEALFMGIDRIERFKYLVVKSYQNDQIKFYVPEDSRSDPLDGKNKICKFPEVINVFPSQ